MDLYLENALQCSKKTTNNYSTSFSLGVGLLDKSIRRAIYAIYGFVRIADEIVDTFFDHNQKVMLQEFKIETFQAIEQGISTNPIIHSFQWAVNTYKIEHHLIDSFLNSMAVDLNKTRFTKNEYKNYIYGSAEVVGLMCLRVFCHEKPELYADLVHPARKLGEAFQKVNFLRDMEADYDERGRTYFPNIDFNCFTEDDKKHIETEIDSDFNQALQGIAFLPLNSRFGVYLAYSYYLQLLKKIKLTPAEKLKQKRIRISNFQKFSMLFFVYLKFTVRQGSVVKQKAKSQQSLIKSNTQQAYA
ncbi:MAG: phytoene synthase [Bacteroidetes bacterium HGW-Bacteroidetes-4]|jgi:phytoene/squalene synthetase|nr:MAG: phytoene synthase [Bacteroidetes bacterium HGW-Bacteroidetes-4]